MNATGQGRGPLWGSCIEEIEEGGLEVLGAEERKLRGQMEKAARCCVGPSSRLFQGLSWIPVFLRRELPQGWASQWLRD